MRHYSFHARGSIKYMVDAHMPRRISQLRCNCSCCPQDGYYIRGRDGITCFFPAPPPFDASLTDQSDAALWFFDSLPDIECELLQARPSSSHPNNGILFYWKRTPKKRPPMRIFAYTNPGVCWRNRERVRDLLWMRELQSAPLVIDDLWQRAAACHQCAYETFLRARVLNCAHETPPRKVHGGCFTRQLTSGKRLFHACQSAAEKFLYESEHKNCLLEQNSKKIFWSKKLWIIFNSKEQISIKFLSYFD